MNQLLLDVLSPPAATLDNYLPGANSAAWAAARALAPGRAIYVWGTAGCGRTHLLRALADVRESEQESEPRVGHYVCAGQAAEPLAAWAYAAEGTVLPRVIAVDDVHRMDAAEQAALFALYNRWRESSATLASASVIGSGSAFALAVAGDCAPLAASLREDLRTRLGWDLVFRLQPLSDADKRTALQQQAIARGLTLTPEVLNWILARYPRDMRALSGLLDALDRYSLAAQRRITIALLRSMLADADAAPAVAYPAACSS